jgi:hypothetical protein
MAGVKPTSFSLFGMEKGRRPEGLTVPKRTSAMALPASCPGIKAVRIAGTWDAQGIKKAPGVLTTTTV